MKQYPTAIATVAVVNYQMDGCIQLSGDWYFSSHARIMEHYGGRIGESFQAFFLFFFVSGAQLARTNSTLKVKNQSPQCLSELKRLWTSVP